MISTDYECHVTYEFVALGQELVISPLTMSTCTNRNNDVTFYVIKSASCKTESRIEARIA
jgi:hypothetical protein